MSSESPQVTPSMGEDISSYYLSRFGCLLGCDKIFYSYGCLLGGYKNFLFLSICVYRLPYSNKKLEETVSLWQKVIIIIRSSLIGLVVGVSWIALPFWIFFCLLEQIRSCFCLFVPFFLLFTTVNSLYFSCFSLINNIIFLLIKKKKRSKGNMVTLQEPSQTPTLNLLHGNIFSRLP